MIRNEVLNVVGFILASKSLDDLRVIRRALVTRMDDLNSQARWQWKIGDKAKFESKGRSAVYGTVVKINRKSIMVTNDFDGFKWKVSPGLLQKV